MKRARQESTPDKIINRYKTLILAVSVPLFVALVLFVVHRSDEMAPSMGRKTAPGGLEWSRRYAVIFDAGSSGSRVHVYCFDEKLDLVHIGRELELFVQIIVDAVDYEKCHVHSVNPANWSSQDDIDRSKKPGLSSYAEDPKEAANSLVSLLEQAERTVPEDLRGRTPVRVGATAGLRTLGDETAEKILQEVRDLLRDKSSLRSQPDWVTVLDGTQEGAYQWVTINYLLGKLGKKYSNTVGVVDLGGGSVQMAYAISESDAAKAPRMSNGVDNYVKELFLKGTKYYLYVYSYLHYGLLAARAEILKVAEDSYSNCILNGYHGSYKYGDEDFQASASPSGASYPRCRSDTVKALKVDEPECTHLKCSFGGVWNGGGGDGQKSLFVASFFFDRAAEAGFVDPNLPVARVKPSDFEAAAKRACKLTVEEAEATFPRVSKDNLPYLCMDLVYQFTLLVDGFALEPWQEITLVKKVQYGDALVEAAWPLGSAIEVASMA